MQTLLAEAEPELPAARWSCDAAKASAALFKDIVQLGEVGAARLRFEQSGRSATDLKSQYDAGLRRLMEAAQAQPSIH